MPNINVLKKNPKNKDALSSILNHLGEQKLHHSQSFLHDDIIFCSLNILLRKHRKRALWGLKTVCHDYFHKIEIM